MKDYTVILAMPEVMHEPDDSNVYVAWVKGHTERQAVQSAQLEAVRGNRKSYLKTKCADWRFLAIFRGFQHNLTRKDPSLPECRL